MTARSTPAQYPRGAASKTFFGPATGAAASTSSGERRRRGTVGIERETAEEVIAPCYRVQHGLPAALCPGRTLVANPACDGPGSTRTPESRGESPPAGPAAEQTPGKAGGHQHGAGHGRRRYPRPKAAGRGSDKLLHEQVGHFVAARRACGRIRGKA